MGLTTKIVSRIAHEIAPEVERLVKTYVAQAVSSDSEVKLLIRSQVKSYLELTRDSLEELTKVNNDLLDRLVRLLDDYDGVRAELRKLSDRIEKVESSLDRKEQRQLESAKVVAPE